MMALGISNTHMIGIVSYVHPWANLVVVDS